MFYTNLLTILLLFLASCASITPPPKAEKMRILREQLISNAPFDLEDLSTEEKWYAAYQLAKFSEVNNLDKSCYLYGLLEKDEKFPLRELAQVKMQKVCSYEEEELDIIWKAFRVPEWLNEFYVLQSLEVARNRNLPEWEASFLSQKIQFLRSDEEKVKVLKDAINMTKDRTKAFQLKEKLYKVSPRHNNEANEDELYGVAKDLEQNREFDQARNVYRKIIFKTDQPFQTKINAWNKLRLSYKKERERNIYIDKTKKMVEFLDNLLKKEPTNQEVAKALLVTRIKLARALWTEDKLEEGRRILMILSRDPALDPPNKALIYQVLGKMESEENNYEQAAIFFEKSLDVLGGPGEFYDELLWDLAWTYFLDQRYGMALEKFRLAKEKSSNHFFKVKLNFWIAKTLKEVGEYEEADEIFEALIEANPYDYYGIVSYRELEVPIPNYVEQENKFETPIPVQWLLALEEKELAKKYLSHLFQYSNWEEPIPYFPLYHSLELHKPLITRFFRIPPEKRKEVLDTHLTYVYPMPSMELVNKYAGDDIKPEYAYAIMRQESAFNPYAKSWAEAYGLMQVIPEEAEKLYKKLDLPYESAEDLYDPKINIPTGIEILKRNQKKFDNQFILITASYNAKDEVVERWVKTRYNEDPVVFIENIPYEETKLYIKLVLRNFILNLRQTKQDAFFFPEGLLTLNRRS